MSNIRRHIVITMGLGVLALVAGLFGHLALTDIYHGEADPTLEWKVVQLSALVVLLFIGSAMVALGRAFRVLGNRSAG
jgi:hypothetical protein